MEQFPEMNFFIKKWQTVSADLSKHLRPLLETMIWLEPNKLLEALLESKGGTLKDYNSGANIKKVKR